MTNLMIHAKARVAGYFKICLRNSLGKVTRETDWMPNLITNLGMDGFGVYPWPNNPAFPQDAPYTLPMFCGVGTGNTPPAFTDTGLTSLIATSTPGLGYGGGAGSYSVPVLVPGPPAYQSVSGTHIFTLGSVVGNIAEVGFGATNASGNPLQTFSHALIVDGSGNPTTIAVTSADQLEVTYELRMYLDLTDTTYNVTMSGTTYTGTIRRANISTQTDAGYVVSPIDAANGFGGYSSPGIYFYPGPIGDVYNIPSGTSSSFYGTAPNPGYTAGTYTKTYTFSFTTAQGNIHGGIGALTILTNMGMWQMSFSPNIAKDSTKTMTLQLSISWARYP